MPFLSTRACASPLCRLFNEAKSEAEDPLKAARVFTNIVDQIGAAKNGTTAAEYATDEVTEVVFPPAQRALGTDAKTAVNASLDLEERARELLEDDVVNLAERFEEEKGRLDGVNATVRRTGMESDGIADRLYRLPGELLMRVFTLAVADGYQFVFGWLQSFRNESSTCPKTPKP